MKPSSQNDHTITGVFVFLLLSIFAVFSMIVVALGVRAYRSTRERAEASSEYRILSSYIRSMARSEDGIADVSVQDEDGVQAIVFEETIGETAYLTRIYVWDGYLREWFSHADNPFQPETGDRICPAGKLEAECTDGLLTARILDGRDRWVEVSTALYADGVGGKQV